MLQETCVKEPDECRDITKIIKNKCDKHSDMYAFHDNLIRAVCHMQKQPSYKEYFEPTGLLGTETKTMTK